MEDKKIEKLFEKHIDKIEEKLDQQTKELKADYLRQGKFLLEQFDKKTQIIAEVQVDQTKKLNAILEMVAQNTEDIGFIKGMLKRKVDLEEFEALEKRVVLLENKLRTA